MKINRCHEWPTTAAAAIELQKRLAPRVRLAPAPTNARLFAGADVAFSPNGEQVVAGVVIWDAEARVIVEQRVARVPCLFPYIPGLLSFRELPGVLAALRKIVHAPDVVLCDAQGLAHPRRLGLACHLGLWLEIPTIGCAKSRLCGDYEAPSSAKGAGAPLMHKGEQVGVVLRTRDNVKPLFVSPGHLCDHDSGTALTLRAAIKYRLPEPTRLAHLLVARARGLE